jgi:hypothetical protein
MPESGQSWRRQFQAHPAEARTARTWVAHRLTHPDAPQVANELFVSVLATGSPTIAMTLSTAGLRIQVTATGSLRLTPLHSHGPGYLIVSRLTTHYGLTTDGQGLWAQLTPKDTP